MQMVLFDRALSLHKPLVDAILTCMKHIIYALAGCSISFVEHLMILKLINTTRSIDEIS